MVILELSSLFPTVSFPKERVNCLLENALGTTIQDMRLILLTALICLQVLTPRSVLLGDPPKRRIAVQPGIELILIEGGCYQMGDTFWEGEQDEFPVHDVCLDDFYLGIHEITQKQWIHIMGTNPSAYKLGDNYPVEWISWNDAQQFIDTLNRITGETFRLPTEAEWEYACRAAGKAMKYGTKTGKLDPTLANYGSGKWGEGDSGDGFEFTSPVGSYPPNQLGIYDMSGNVFEWVDDWKSLNQNYYRSSPRLNPGGADRSPRKVGRGGAWNFGPYHQRCANRFSNWPDFRCLSFGFRLAKTP